MTLTPIQEAQLDQPTRVNAYVYIHVPELVFEAPLVSHTTRDGGIVSLIVGIPTAGSLIDVGPEMALQIDINGRADGGRQRVRGVNGADSEILIGRSAPGGIDGRITVSKGGTVRVYRDYRPFLKALYINPPPNITIFKDETPFTTDNAAQPPVACAGRDRLIITDGDNAEVTLDGDSPDAPSFAVREGATIIGYQWDVPDGTVQSGALNEASVTILFPRGVRYISLTVTDSNGITHTAHRLIAVLRPEDCIPAQLGSLTLAPDGATLTATVLSNYLPDDIPSGAKVLVAERENYRLPVSGYYERFSGWITTESATIQDAQRRKVPITLNLQDIGHFLKATYLFSQSINITGEGALGGWYLLANANIMRLMHYILQWHTNVLNLVDFIPALAGEFYPFNQYTTRGGTVYQGANALADAFAHEMTIDSRGRIRVVPNPLVTPTPEQAIEYTVPTFRPTGVITTFGIDRYSNFTLDAFPSPSNYWMTAMGQVASTAFPNSVVSCIAPGNAPSRGTGMVNRTNYLTLNQMELNVWVANLWASYYDSPVGELTLKTRFTGHIIEPAERQFVGVNFLPEIAARYNLPDDINNRWVVNQVTYTYGERKATEYRLVKEVVASDPAHTTVQAAQAWNGFDSSIIPTTGTVAQEIIPMAFNGLTQEQLEETINRTWLKMGTGEVRIGPDGTIDPDGGGGTDPTDPTEYERIQSSLMGGYYNVSLELNRFWGRVAEYYTTVSSDPNVETLMQQYIKGMMLDSASTDAEIDAWVTYFTDPDPDQAIATLDLDGREDSAQFMYCDGTTRGGLNQYAYTLDDPERVQVLEGVKPMSNAQLSRWYEQGRGSPSDLYMSAPCAKSLPETFNIPASKAQDSNVSSRITGNIIRRYRDRLDGSIIQLVISGRMETENYIFDGFYRINKETQELTYALIDISLRVGAGATQGVVWQPQSRPAYRADGNYRVTGYLPRPQAFISEGVIVIIAYRTEPALSGQFTMTVVDLGPA